MKNKENNEKRLELSRRMRLMGKIVFLLNRLVEDLPIEIHCFPYRKGFSDEWLNENGYGWIKNLQRFPELNDCKGQ